MRDERTTNDEQLKIELLSQWKLEAEFRNELKQHWSPWIVRVTWTSTAILAALEVQCTVQRDQGDKSTENIGKAPNFY